MFYMTNALVVRRIQYFLDKFNTTPYRLDKEGKIPKTTLYAILNGERTATSDFIKRFCIALEISIDDFYGEMHDIAVYTEDQEKLIEIIRISNEWQVAKILAYASKVVNLV